MGFFDRFRLGVPAPQITAGVNEPPARGSVDTRWVAASRFMRSMRSWLPVIGSGKTDLNAAEQRTMRVRSRDAIRNHPVARAAITRTRTNIVGTGLMCHPAIDFEVLGIDPIEAEEINKQALTNFHRWASDPTECDAEATLSFYGLQGLSLVSAMSSGDCLATTPMVTRPGGVTALKVQLVEADRVENPNNGPNNVALWDGVAIDPELGAPLGYWIRSNHPGDLIPGAELPTWTYFAAFGAETGRRRVMHIWNDKERPGQVRGAPYLAPVLEPLKQLSRWSDNEMMRAVVSALFTVFLKQAAPPALDASGLPLPAFGGANPEIIPGSDPSSYAPPAKADDVSMGNGAVVSLMPGEEPVFANPATPNQQFDPFFVACVKQIGAALELPVDELLLSYQSSYSAARAAMLQAWRFYTLRRDLLVEQFCQPIYGLWMDEEVASGRLSLPGYGDPIRRRAWSNAIWIGPARGSMDEFQEARAAKERINIGVSNEAIETAQMTGESWDSVYAQRLREINRRKADGTYTSGPPTETVRVSPVTDPSATPKTPSDPGAAPPDGGDSAVGESDGGGTDESDTGGKQP